ncbi:MAG: hypothetical protein M3367_03910, partial [Acidobacteriota bacterium]|nr:hypothetical protein [Acidobacteriota bacterium]
MNNYRKRFFQIFSLSLSVVLFSITALAQQVQRTPFDVTNYRMDVQLVPDENKLNATVDVNFTPAEDTRTVSFELNGSLKIESITRQNSFSTTAQPKTKTAVTSTANQVTFVQDQTGVSDLGPSVRIDFGEAVTKGTPITLRFKYGGVLNSPSGGPLLT